MAARFDLSIDVLRPVIAAVAATTTTAEMEFHLEKLNEHVNIMRLFALVRP